MRRFLPILAAALALAVAACGSSGGTAHDAGTAGRDGAPADGGDGKAGGGAGTAGGAGSSGAGTAGGAGTTGAAGTGAAVIPGSKILKLVTGAVALIGSGPDSCTSLPGATADRWCAFLRQSALTNAIELWVVDVTSLVAGAPVACDGTSPGCKQLSRTAVFDQDFGAAIHRFYGDTLIYFADAGAASATGFVGTIWAWQPGWATARKLTSTMGNDCTANAKGDAIACLQGAGQVVAGELSVEILAGRPPVADDMPLASLERTVIAAMNDAPGVQKFQLNFTVDGSYVAWSSRASATAPETLKVQKIADAASRQTVTTDVSVWEITADGKSWLWLRGFNYNPAAPSGTLESAPFPAGTPPVTLATGVSTYHGFPGTSLLFQTATGAELRRMPDRAVPATTQLLDQGVAGVLDFSDDGSKVVYAKNFDDLTGLVDMFVRDAAAAAPCPVAGPATAVPTATLFSKAGTVLWARLDNNGLLQGMATPIASCKPAPFANNVLRWNAAGDDALTILDDTAPAADDSTLRYSLLANGVLPASGTPLQTHVTGVYAPLVPTLPAILYTGATTATAGLYAYTGAPLAGTTPPAADGGAAEAGNDASADAADAGADTAAAADTGADDAADGN